MATDTPRICVIGSANIDLVARVDRSPQPGETLHGHGFHMGFGGKGANQAVMAARLGARVSMIARLGRDTFGENTLANFRQQAVDTTYVLFDDSAASGVALITVDEQTGQNAIVIASGANDMLTPEDARRARSAIETAQVIVGQIEIPLAATTEAFRIAKAAGVITIFNPAPAAPLPDELLALTDVLIPNEVEAAMLTGQPVDSHEQAVTAGRALQDRGIKTVIVTLGSRGALVLDGSTEPQFITAAKVQAVDTTGAGDAFVGSFAYWVAAGRSWGEAARIACAVATRSVLKRGTQMSFPSRDEVLELLT